MACTARASTAFDAQITRFCRQRKKKRRTRFALLTPLAAALLFVTAFRFQVLPEALLFRTLNLDAVGVLLLKRGCRMR